MKRFALALLLPCSFAYGAENSATVETSVESAKGEGSRFGSVTANLALTSDYMFRGQTQTNHQAAVQGGADWTHSSGAYAGAWGSNTRIPDGTMSAEADVYGGYKYALTEDWNIGLGAYYYSYFKNWDANTLEFPLQLSWKTAKGGLAYSPHWGGGNAGHAWYASASWSTVVRWETTLTLGSGVTFFAPEFGLHDYSDFHVGLSRDMWGVSWDASGYFVGARQFDGADDPRGVLTVSKAF